MSVTESSASRDWSALSPAFADSLVALTAHLDTASVGVAFYDRRFRCEAVNHAFADIWRASPEAFLGKNISISFGSHSRKLKSLVQRAFSSKAVICNFELVNNSAKGSAALHWLINLYPLTDARGRVNLVAMAVCESETKDSLEFHLANLAAKLHECLPASPLLSDAGFPELLSRSLQFAARSVQNLRGSVEQGSPLDGAQLETDLMPLALFLSLSGLHGSAAPAAISGLVPAHLEEDSQIPPIVPVLASDPAPALTDVPSPRELQVLRHLATGQSNKEIGLALGISTRTVETYRARIIRKLSLHSTAELVRYAIRHKIIEL
jgi:DNA-binding CsgD family transcriptional regulator